MTAGIASTADAKMSTLDASGLKEQFIGGLLRGEARPPCTGRTLGAAIELASQGKALLM
ncbi:Cytochrome c biogenesis protein [Sulfitobacter guttiformis KCTC 32187]|nr:Cytochrome c biogenesis protein [Sulfitobacter guttiformis KCTC 32187]